MPFLNLKVGVTYVYGWNRMRRKDELCRLLVIGAPRFDSVLVEFKRDSFKAVTSAKALKEVPANHVIQPRIF